MNLAIFDLDNTLLGGDSDYLWGRFLVREGIVDADEYEQANEQFYADYKAGTLDIYAYQRFALAPLVGRDPALLSEWHKRFMAEHIDPIMLPAARLLLDQHRARGEMLIIITATNRFVTGPIAEALGVDLLFATEPEIVDGRYTGNVTDIPCFQEGKVQRLQNWLTETGNSLAGSTFYSDSHNDLPLLEMVERPVAVDPDPVLTDHARMRGWEIISLRGPTPAAVSA